MLVDRIYETIDFLNEVDNTELQLKTRQLELDNMTQDLLHYLENNILKSFELVRLARELKKVREERKQVKNDLAIINEYKKNCMQLQNSKGRETLRNIIKKQDKINNGKYHNRVYKLDELESLIKNRGVESNGQENN